MQLSQKLFGKMPDGREVIIFTFESKKGLSISIINLGGIITSIRMPDKNGQMDEIVAGFPSLQPYLNGHPYFGAIVGRYANRIADAGFTINGIHYKLSANDNKNHIHGGLKGYDSQLWEPLIEINGDTASLTLKHLSPDGEEGYPGNVENTVIYSLDDNNHFNIRFEAHTDAPTHINLTQHTYFNLGGFRNNISDHRLFINSNFWLETNESNIPTGKLFSCKQSAFNFTEPNPVCFPIDNCFVLSRPDTNQIPSAMLLHQSSGRSITFFLTQPGIQVYTGNYLDGSLRGHNNVVYNQYGAICLEPQHFPNSPNTPDFPSTLLMPGQLYSHQIKMHFE